MYHLLRRQHGTRPAPTPEAVEQWIRESLYRGLICSTCGNMTEESDSFCGICGHYLNGVIDQEVAQALEIVRHSQAEHKRRR